MSQRIVIIGGGPAGYEAALVAAQYGADVTVVDSDGIGGNCVLHDCVPSKAFIATTGVRTDMRRVASTSREGRRPSSRSAQLRRPLSAHPLQGSASPAQKADVIGKLSHNRRV